MFDIKKFYEKENEEVKSSYENTLKLVKDICNETREYEQAGEKKEYYQFLNTIGNHILKFSDYEKNLKDDYFFSKSFEELLKENNEFFQEVLPENYQESYANPTYCVKILGDKFGQLLSYFYVKYRQYINYTFSHKIYKMEEHNKLFIEVFNYIKNNKLEYEYLKKLISSIDRKDKTRNITIRLKEQFDKNFKHYFDIVENADLSDLRYLFRYGNYITQNEVKTAKFLSGYPENKIKKLSNQVAKAYINGFLRDNKDISKKSTIMLIFNSGQERIIRQLIKDLKKNNLDSIINFVSSTTTNKQYHYDHRFDASLCLNKEYTDLKEKNYVDAFENCKDISSIYSGVIHFGKFGEPPFKPETKKECLRFSEEQQKLMQIHQNNIMKIHYKYVPRSETSFTVISFPSPEIGENFEPIFEDILEINMLETEKYESIQQKIIDALDKADYVHVKGKGDCETDIMVKMQEIGNREKETNFVNCGADVNIPLGEVFTSPKLKGTNGILHVKETYLGGLKYLDLKLNFKDGYISEYSCKNFEKEEENKKYIEENLMFPHKTLPVGEFAIGTNTLAYVIARKHKILDVLPILIIEKMGPHFAVGDTCFSMEEDRPVYNSDGKEIIARDNEKTALRKTKPKEAYTFCHTDITIPYESIEFISSITKTGEKIDIIRDEKFFLKGTEVLNKPFKEMINQ